MKQFFTLLAAVLFTATTLAQGNLTVTSNVVCTIDPKGSLTVNGDFLNTDGGTVILNSSSTNFSSIIVKGIAKGDIVYYRFVNSHAATGGGYWDLVGSPVSSPIPSQENPGSEDLMEISDFVSSNKFNLHRVEENAIDYTYAIGLYENDIDEFAYYSTAVGDEGGFPSQGLQVHPKTFVTARGYAMATANVTGQIVKYWGGVRTSDFMANLDYHTVIDPVTNLNMVTWNLVSNPFPSYINGNESLGTGTKNFLDENANAFDQGDFWGVYRWTGNEYTPYNLSTPAFYIAPGQGFFVASREPGIDPDPENPNQNIQTEVNFFKEMRTISGGDDFITGAPILLNYRLALKLYNADVEQAKTNFYFKNGLTLGLDPGYDAGAFNQTTKLSTRLAQGSQETAFSINAMDINSLENARVPLEIRQNAGQAFRVSMADMELPENTYVYLEDTLNGTVTSLNDGDFELTALSDLSGAERFFIIFKDNSLLSNGDTLGIDALNIYKANIDSFITIAGITPDLGKLDVTVYNILGMTVREKALNPATTTQRVFTDGLASGLYVVQVRSANQIFNKKIIIE